MAIASWSRIERWSSNSSRAQIGLLCIALVLAMGYVDYITGIWISLSVIYVVPIALSAWYVGPGFAYGIAGLSAIVWVLGDMFGGMAMRGVLPLWNGTIRLLFYAVLIYVLDRLHRLQNELGERVQERAAALTREIAERERLERELTEVGERERRRFGQDLHDGLCQHLTGTALASQVLAHKLTQMGLPEARESQKIVDLVEEGITLARGMAKGLHPVETQPDGLMQALDEFASTVSELYRTDCIFECDSPVLVENPTVATHLYRIAQEAVNNALRHARSARIVIRLESTQRGLALTILDDGAGIAEPLPMTGMGLKIMADRAKVIGGLLTIQRQSEGGTEVSCILADHPVQHG